MKLYRYNVNEKCFPIKYLMYGICVYKKLYGKYDENKVGLESLSDVYRVRRRPAYSSVTSFLILAKQGAAAPFDTFPVHRWGFYFLISWWHYSIAYLFAYFAKKFVNVFSHIC